MDARPPGHPVRPIGRVTPDDPALAPICLQLAALAVCIKALTAEIAALRADRETDRRNAATALVFAEPGLRLVGEDGPAIEAIGPMRRCGVRPTFAVQEPLQP